MVAAANLFYKQTRDLTQHGKKDHPTDRIVLDETAAALELAANSSGVKYFDGYDPPTGNLIDAKNWENFPHAFPHGPGNAEDPA